MSRLSLLPVVQTLAIACGCSFLVSCTNVLGIEDTNLQQQDAAPASPSQDWSCVGVQEPAKATKDKLTITIAATEFAQVNPPPLEDLEVRICAGFDAQCAQGSAPVLTNAQGEATLTVDVDDSGFGGYLQFSKQGYMTLLWLFSRKPTEDFTLPPQMVSETTFPAILGSLNVPVDPTLGHLTFTVYSCGVDAKGPVLGEGVEVDVLGRDVDTSKRFYAGDLGFAPDTTQSATNKSGQAAIFNLAPGSASAVVRSAGGAQILSQAGGLPIRANTISTIYMYPLQK